MEDTETNDISTETLRTQFKRVRTRTASGSPVLKFGDESFMSEVIGDF